MKPTKARVRLTAKDWKAIYDALVVEHGCECAGCMQDRKNNCRVLRRIGLDGMAARDRGVAAVPRRRKV